MSSDQQPHADPPTADQPAEVAHHTLPDGTVCQACATLDAADGAADGRFGGRHRGIPVKNPRRAVAAMSRAQDRAADRVTAFAG